MNTVGFPLFGIEFKMNPIAIPLPFGSGGIRWYALIIMAGILLGMYAAVKETKRLGEDPDHLYNMVLWGLPAAIVGARLYYVLFSFSAYKDNLLSVFYIWEGGLAIYGGVIGAFLVGALYCKKYKLSPWKFLDVGAYGFLIGQCIGRWGNFVNAEAYGTATNLPWRMLINGHAVHPTFLYESLWNLVLFLLIWCTRKKHGFEGRAISLYMIGYGIGRLFIEGLRTDSLWLGNFRVSQLLSAVLIIVGICVFTKRKKIHRDKEEEQL